MFYRGMKCSPRVRWTTCSRGRATEVNWFLHIHFVICAELWGGQSPRLLDLTRSPGTSEEWGQWGQYLDSCLYLCWASPALAAFLGRLMYRIDFLLIHFSALSRIPFDLYKRGSGYCSHFFFVCQVLNYDWKFKWFPNSRCCIVKVGAFPSENCQTQDKVSFRINLATERIVKVSLKQLTVFKSEHFMHSGRNPPRWSEGCGPGRCCHSCVFTFAAGTTAPNQELCRDVCSLLPSH